MLSVGIYISTKRKKLVKGKYSVEVVGHNKKKILWEVVGDHVVEEPSDHEEIGLRGFDLIFLMKTRRGL